MEALVREGIGVSPGVAIGPALVLESRVSHVPKFNLAPDRVDHEIARLDEAVGKVREQLALIEDKAGRELGSGIAQIIDAQRLMLADRSFLEPIRQRITQLGQNAEWAVKSVGDDLSERFAQISDEYIRQRRNDLDDLANRLLRTLSGLEPHRLADLDHAVVLFAYDLAPSDTALLDPQHVIGFATDLGGRTSHTAIMARSLEIPAVVGLHDATERVRSGDQVVLDGHDGRLIVHPSGAMLQEYRGKQETIAGQDADLLRDRHLEARTPDGVLIRLAANIGNAPEAALARQYGTVEVGLFRSEFLYLRRRVGVPTEEDHYAEYRATLEQMDTVTVRTLDLGGEKKLPSESRRLQGADSLLGVRAIRHSLRDRSLFVKQLRGLLRASPHGNLRIVLPFITSLQELRTARAVLERVRQDLIAEGTEIAEQIPLGVMVEVPAAALVVDHLARECDFLSIGTNDLIQYLLAVDRNNTAVAHLYEPLHPAVLRLLRQVTVTARRCDTPLSLCGEAAADPLTAMVFLGLGITELSMSPSSIPVIKSLIRRVPFAESREILTRALRMRTAQEVEEFALARLMAHFPDGFLAR